MSISIDSNSSNHTITSCLNNARFTLNYTITSSLNNAGFTQKHTITSSLNNAGFTLKHTITSSLNNAGFTLNHTITSSLNNAGFTLKRTSIKTKISTSLLKWKPRLKKLRDTFKIRNPPFFYPISFSSIYTINHCVCPFKIRRETANL